MSDMDLLQEFIVWCKENGFTMDNDLRAAFVAGATKMRQYYATPSFPPMDQRH